MSSAEAPATGGVPAPAPRRRWPRVVVGIVVTILGAGALVAGEKLADCEPYWSSVLSNAGVALFLVLPILLAEQILARKVEASEARNEQRSEGLRSEVAAARTEFQAQLGQLRAQTEAAFQAARD